MRNVVLLSTRRLPPTYFDTVIEDLGGDPSLGLNVVAWMPPSGYVADKVETFTLIGPGRMPAKPAEPEPTEAATATTDDPAGSTDAPGATTGGPSDQSPDAVIAPEAVAEPDSVTTEGEVTPAAAEVPDTAGPAEEADTTGSTDAGSADTASAGGESAGSAGVHQAPASGASDNASTTPSADSDQESSPAGGATEGGSQGAAPAGSAPGTGAPAAAKKPAGQPRPTGVKRVVKAVAWRYRRLRKAGVQAVPASVKKSRAVQFLRRNKQTNEVAENYWGRLEARPDVLEKVTKADVVIALDAGAIWAGWQLGQRYGQKPVVLGLPAARRELDRIKAGH